MSARDLKALLDQIADTRELVLRHAEPARVWSPAYLAWSDAHEEAESALRRWRSSATAEAYAAYRAAQDREDAAQDALFRAVADERVAAVGVVFIAR